MIEGTSWPATDTGSPITKRMAALAGATVTFLALLNAGGRPAAAAADIGWGRCENQQYVEAGAECGMLSVPLDYDHPGGGQVKIALSRVKHTVPESEYQGVMITVAGGPGGSGLQTFTTAGNTVPRGASNAYDWISFDARGVGSSEPALSCDKSYLGYNRPEYVPTTPALERTWLARTRKYAEDCGASGNAALLEHVKTTDTARDIDSIRTALGAPQVTLYGLSYGTYVLQVYGTMFPSRVRRMVMDSSVDPRYVFYRVNLNQDRGMQNNFQAWMNWVARHDSVYHLGTTEAQVRQVYDNELDKLRVAPAGGEIGPSELIDATFTVGYRQANWIKFTEDFVSLLAGVWEPMKAQYADATGHGDDNFYAMYLATQCTDVQWPTDWNVWKKDNWRMYRLAPYTTWANAWFNAPCIHWPAKAGKRVKVDGSRVPSVLMISESGDGAEPFEGSIEVRKRFPGASLIAEFGGTSHAVALTGNACVDDKIADYLLTGRRPTRNPNRNWDHECAPTPEPEPDK